MIKSPLHTVQTETTTPTDSLSRFENARLNQEGNGELKRLLELKRTYRAGAAALETELKVYALALETELKKYREEIAYRNKRLKEKYLEDLEDFIFAEPAEQQTSRAEESTSSAVEDRVASSAEQTAERRDPQQK